MKPTQTHTSAGFFWILHYSSEWFVAKLWCFLPHLWGMDDALALSFTLLLRVFTVTGGSGKKSAPFQPYVLSSSRRLGCVCVKWCLAFIALISINNILHVWHIIWWLAGRHKHTELIDNQQGTFWKLGMNEFHWNFISLIGVKLIKRTQTDVLIVTLFALWRKKATFVFLRWCFPWKNVTQGCKIPLVFKKKKRGTD